MERIVSPALRHPSHGTSTQSELREVAVSEDPTACMSAHVRHDVGDDEITKERRAQGTQRLGGASRPGGTLASIEGILRPYGELRTATIAIPPPGAPVGTTVHAFGPCRVTVRPASTPTAAPNTTSLAKCTLSWSRE